MWRRLFLAATVGILAVLAISDMRRFDGPVLFRITSDHGLHALDVFALTLAACALAVLASPGRP